MLQGDSYNGAQSRGRRGALDLYEPSFSKFPMFCPQLRKLPMINLDNLLSSLEPGQEQWKRQNESRPRIAAVVGVDIATWTVRNKSAKTMARDATRLERAAEALNPLPGPGEYLHVVTGQEFAGFDLLSAFLSLSKVKQFKALTLTTLGFSKANLSEMAKMIDARQVAPKTLRILCSDFFRRSDKDIWKIGAAQAKTLGYGFRSTRNHTKLILADVGRPYIVESSANLRSCSNLEQFTVTQSRRLYDFHAGWISRVWETSEA